MRSLKWKAPRLVQAHHRRTVGEGARRVTARALRPELPLVHVLMAGGARRGGAGKVECLVTRRARGAGVRPLERKCLWRVLELTPDHRRPPPVGAVARSCRCSPTPRSRADYRRAAPGQSPATAPRGRAGRGRVVASVRVAPSTRGVTTLTGRRQRTIEHARRAIRPTSDRDALVTGCARHRRVRTGQRKARALVIETRRGDELVNRMAAENIPAIGTRSANGRHAATHGRWRTPARAVA